MAKVQRNLFLVFFGFELELRNLLLKIILIIIFKKTEHCSTSPWNQVIFVVSALSKPGTFTSGITGTYSDWLSGVFLFLIIFKLIFVEIYPKKFKLWRRQSDGLRGIWVVVIESYPFIYYPIYVGTRYMSSIILAVNSDPPHSELWWRKQGLPWTGKGAHPRQSGGLAHSHAFQLSSRFHLYPFPVLKRDFYHQCTWAFLVSNRQHTYGVTVTNLGLLLFSFRLLKKFLSTKL